MMGSWLTPGVPELSCELLGSSSPLPQAAKCRSPFHHGSSFLKSRLSQVRDNLRGMASGPDGTLCSRQLVGRLSLAATKPPPARWPLLETSSLRLRCKGLNLRGGTPIDPCLPAAGSLPLPADRDAHAAAASYRSFLPLPRNGVHAEVPYIRLRSFAGTSSWRERSRS